MARASAAADDGGLGDTGERPRVADDAGQRRRGSGQRRREECPATLALTALEVAVRGADRVLPGPELVAVHRDAHRAARLAPLRARGPEDVVEGLLLGLLLHLRRARDDHQADVPGDAPVAKDRRSEPQVADPAVRAA